MSATLAAPAYTASAFEVARDREAQRKLDREARWLGDVARQFPGEDWKTTLTRRCYLLAEACGEHPLTGRRYYTAADFLGEVERAVEGFGCAVPKIGPSTVTKLARYELVPNLRIRERFERLERDTGLTTSRVALALGAKRTVEVQSGSGIRGDSTRVERMLGMKRLSAHGGVKWIRLFITYEQAVAFADVLGIDYHDLGV